MLESTYQNAPQRSSVRHAAGLLVCLLIGAASCASREPFLPGDAARAKVEFMRANRRTLDADRIARIQELPFEPRTRLDERMQRVIEEEAADLEAGQSIDAGKFGERRRVLGRTGTELYGPAGAPAAPAAGAAGAVAAAREIPNENADENRDAEKEAEERN
ncbi:MAG: hypothetical protein L0Z55_04110 [Planctomycetes bacterium]|nr:hypothetical protein [Planctomycetota bacterium]